MINYQLWGLFGPQIWPIWLLVLAAGHFIGRDRRGPRHRRGRALTLAAAGVALLFGATPLGSWLIEPLEQRLPATKLNRPPATILVLGGAESLAASEWRGKLEVNGAGERVLEGVALAHSYPGAKLAIAGGIRLTKSTITDVGMVRDAWVRMGVDPARIEVVDSTADTCANAIGARRLAQPILLVTSAAHMPRAIACMRAAGIDPWRDPVDFNAIRPGRANGDYLSSVDRLDFALHEWIGLAWYRLSGRTRELLPAATGG